jgi:hypothetical protein
MNDFEFYSSWKVEVGGQQGKKEIKKFSDMTRGQVIKLLRERGYVSWRFCK